MTDMKNSLLAMSAIAAVLAFATPAMAQEVTPAPAATAPDPVSVTPPVVDPAPTAITPATPATPAPVDPLSATVANETAPAPAAAPLTTRTRATTAAPAPARAARTPRIAPRLPVAATPTPTSPAPVEAIAPLGAPIVAATPLAASAVPVEAPEAQAESATKDVLPIAAAGGLGLLALLGAGVALRRRKRREEEETEFAGLDEPQFEQPDVPAAYAEPVREPTVKRPPFTQRAPTPVATAVASKPIDAPAASLPDGFDLSRFGPHVQAAYRGPREDNPSLSLKNRLRRASAMDQTARGNDEPMQPAPPRPLTAAASTRDSGAVVSKMGPASSTGAFILGGDATRPAMRRVTQH